MSYQAMRRHGENKNILSERSQSERTIYYLITATWHSGKGKTKETGRDQRLPGFGVDSGQEWVGGAQRNFKMVKILW